MTENPNRQPAGTPTGGQFAASAHAEAEVALAPQAPLAPAPMTAADEEHLAEYRGEFRDGYTDEDIEAALLPIKGAQMRCIWNSYDGDFYGDSEIIGRVGDGPWRRIHPDLWEHLTDPDSDIDLARTPLLADGAFAVYERQDIDDLHTDYRCNVAVDDETGCENCGGSLDDGSGYDGYCGTCADRQAEHDGGRHEGRPDEDCPDCAHVFSAADAMRKAAKGE